MKKILMHVMGMLFFMHFGHAQTCSPTTTFNGTGTSVFTVSDPNGSVGGTMTVANGVKFENGSGSSGVLGSRECRAYKSITALDNTTFTAECTVSLTAGNNPSHGAMAFSAGTLEFAYSASGCPDQTTQNACSYASSNQSSIVVYVYDPGVTGSISDITANGTAIVAYTKVGNAGHVMASSAIVIPSSAIGNFKIRFERISLSKGRLSYVNASTNAVITSTCVTIPSSIIDLNTLQTGVQTSASPERNLTGTVNDYKIYNTCNVTTLPAPTANPGAAICANNTKTLTASTTTSSPTFSWYNVPTGGTALATGASYTTPVLASGQTYYVSYEDACGQISPRTAVTVTVNPATTVAPITGSSTVCKNQIIALECATPGGVWSSSDITKATVKQTGVVTGVAVGTVTISYTVAGTCPGVSTKVLTINDVVSFIIVGPSPVCPNTSGNAYYVSPSVTGADYTWNIQDGPNVGVQFPVNGSTNTTLTIPESVVNNQFTLRCQGLNACGASELITKLITVNTSVPPAPNVDCSGTGCSTLFVTNNSGSTIQWIVDGVVEGTSTTFVRPAYKSVLCTYTSTTSGCKKSTWYSPAVVCTYAARVANAEDSNFPLKVYPNPNEGNFVFVTQGYTGKALVINVMGQVVEEISVEETNVQYEVSMKNQHKGTYVLKLVGGVDTHVSVFVIQ